MKLKFYHADEHLLFGDRHKQYPVSVIARSREKVIELMAKVGPILSLVHVTKWFSMVDGPSDQLKDAPLEESVWLKPDPSLPIVRIWPRPFKVGDLVRFHRRVQDSHPNTVRSVTNGMVKLDSGVEWPWGCVMLDSEWQKKQKRKL